MDAISYHIFDSVNDEWLAEDEQTWSPLHRESAAFTHFETADAICERETKGSRVPFVVAFLH